MYDGVALTMVRPTNALRAHLAGRGWGRIINIASAQGVQAFGMMPDYATAKSAVIALTKSLSKHLDRAGALVNEVALTDCRVESESGLATSPPPHAVSSTLTRHPTDPGRRR